jgi:hypothetical protein
VSGNRIISPLELPAFRAHWNGRRVLGLLAQNQGKLLINWEVGVGKSHTLDDAVEAAVASGRYDLVVALLPTRQVLAERRWIKKRPRDVKVIHLIPRPTARCGDLNKEWQVLERNGMAALGRVRLCISCPKWAGCLWPGQYGKRMRGAQVIFGTQAHLERDPLFLSQLRIWTGASRVLLLLDEANFIAKSYRTKISREDLERFLLVLGLVK